MGDIQSQAKFFVDGPFGNFQLLKVKDCSVSDGSDAEVATVVGVDEGAGFTFKPGGYEIQLEVFRETDNPELDYRKHKRLKTRFAYTIQDVDGKREQYRPCIIAKVDRKDDDQGSHMDTVKIIALRRVDL